MARNARGSFQRNNIYDRSTNKLDWIFGRSYSAETLRYFINSRANWCFLISYYESRKTDRYINPTSMKLTIIAHTRARLPAIIGGLAEDTKMAARDIVTPTRHIIYVHPVATPR